MTYLKLVAFAYLVVFVELCLVSVTLSVAKSVPPTVKIEVVMVVGGGHGKR